MVQGLTSADVQNTFVQLCRVLNAVMLWGFTPEEARQSNLSVKSLLSSEGKGHTEAMQLVITVMETRTALENQCLAQLLKWILVGFPLVGRKGGNML